MTIYLDINDTLLTHDLKPAEGLKSFLEFILKGNDVYWLSTHCKGDAGITADYLKTILPKDTHELIEKIRPTNWKTLKTEAIDFSKDFLWFDDFVFDAERKTLEEKDKLKSWVKIDLRNHPLQLISWLENKIVFPS